MPSSFLGPFNCIRRFFGSIGGSMHKSNREALIGYSDPVRALQEIQNFGKTSRSKQRERTQPDVDIDIEHYPRLQTVVLLVNEIPHNAPNNKPQTAVPASGRLLLLLSALRPQRPGVEMSRPAPAPASRICLCDRSQATKPAACTGCQSTRCIPSLRAVTSQAEIAA